MPRRRLSPVRPEPAGLKTIVWFQGGGPLGAFGCGVWQALVPALRAQGSRIVALGGASIGALNAAIVRPHLDDPDGGAAVLEAVWRSRIATPSWPFIGLPWARWPGVQQDPHWNGLLTGIVAGNGLYRPQPSAWSLWGMANRVQCPLFDRSRMWRLLDEQVEPYESRSPDDVLLAVSSTDVAGGRLRLHLSDNGPIGPSHVGASSAVPGMFDPVSIDGELQWDGDMLPISPLPRLVRAVRDSGRAGEDDVLQLVTIEGLPNRAPDSVRTTPEVLYRAVNLAQVDKLAGPVDGPVQRVRIVRPDMPFDGISGMFDHSPERIAALIETGHAQASDAMALGEAAPPAALLKPGRASALQSS